MNKPKGAKKYTLEVTNWEMGKATSISFDNFDELIKRIAIGPDKGSSMFDVFITMMMV